MELDEFPVGATLADRWTIRQALHGGPDRGVFRGDGPVLVTMGPPQPLSNDQLAARFVLPTASVAPLLGIASIHHAGLHYAVLVEAEPAGKPLTERRPANPRIVAASLARAVATAHANGHVLAGIRPELVYSDGENLCTGIAPRTEPFLALAERRGYGVAPCFLEVYMSPEALSLEPPTFASDVFSLCATLVYLLQGRPPFAGETVLERMSAAMRGRLAMVPSEPSVRAGLDPQASARPDAEVIARALDM